MTISTFPVRLVKRRRNLSIIRNSCRSFVLGALNRNWAAPANHPAAKVGFKEVIGEAIKLLERNHTQFTINFLRENFDIKEERSDEWRIDQFNRNRSIEDQVSTIEEMEKRVDEIFNS